MVPVAIFIGFLVCWFPKAASTHTDRMATTNEKRAPPHGIPCAGWRFSREHGEWQAVPSPSTPASLTDRRPLRFATLNVLHDNAQPELLQHDIRQDAICAELASVQPDVIGLNEVTQRLLERLLREDWVRDGYTVSAVPGDVRCSHVTTVQGPFGNLLLSKIPPVSVAYVEQPGDGRHSHVMTLLLHDERPQGGRPRRVAVCSTHLTACPWLMEGRRKRQLEVLTAALAPAATWPGVEPKGDDGRDAAPDACVIMGDFNFHREAENASIPLGWQELPAVVDLGETWDFGRNAMLAHYLPLRNIYNGLGLGAHLGWPSPMRLDRVLVSGGGLDVGGATARTFADRPIHERAQGRTPLPQAGRELQAAHRALPWQEYLFPSDHFGIAFELSFAPGAYGDPM